MVINIDEDFVLRSIGLTPHVGLIENHQIESSFRQAVAAVGQRFGVEKVAIDSLDPTGLAANVPWRADMPRPVLESHRDAVARLESAGAFAHGSPHSFSNSARRRSISSLVRIFFSIRIVSMLAIQRS